MQWDFIIIGSGFGGSVCALRLVEKGYRVLLLERGGRFRAQDFPRTNWDLARWLWLPRLGWRGMFKMTFLPHLTALSGVGVGGGSLVYANTLPTPPDAFFDAESWRHLADWRRELTQPYAIARRMLGATPVPQRTYADEVIRDVARDIGREAHFEAAQVGVYFGEPGVTVPDPYFDGAGPTRTGCVGCGGCMVGCRFNAKNTLDKNYLYLAERRGLQLEADTEVTWVCPAAGGGYVVTARAGTDALESRREEREYRARQVVFAGGVLGTVDLLLRLRASAEGLPRLSARLGERVRTNSEVLMGVVGTAGRDMSQGVAIGSILHTDAYSHLEPVRYNAGSGFFRILAMPHAPGATLRARLGAALRGLLRHPLRFLRAYCVGDWARATLILLYMRTIEGTLRLRRGRHVTTGFKRGLVTEVHEGRAPSAAIPEATDLAERVAAKIDGSVQSLVTETLLGIPTTAHILGGCAMGTGAEEGVIDHRHRLFGYDGLYVVDGSAVSANPGVNPSLTITALAERAMAFIPDKASG